MNPNIPPRPQLIDQQLRNQHNTTHKILNRQQCTQYVAMLAANLAQHLNNRTQLPWITATIDQRTNGFSLHIQVLDTPNGDDAT